MALDDPFDFGTPQQEAPASGTGLAQQWQSFLDGGGRTAMMQMGLQMMQPIGFGETPLSNAAKGLGMAGEALSDRDVLTRRENRERIRDETAQRRLELQEEKLDIARSRTAGGGRAGVKATPGVRSLDPLAQERLNISRSREERLSGRKGINDLFEGRVAEPVPFQAGGAPATTGAEGLPPAKTRRASASASGGDNPRLNALFQSAREAIANGAPAEQVRARLRQRGIDPSGI